MDQFSWSPRLCVAWGQRFSCGRSGSVPPTRAGATRLGTSVGPLSSGSVPRPSRTVTPPRRRCSGSKPGRCRTGTQLVGGMCSVSLLPSAGPHYSAIKKVSCPPPPTCQHFWLPETLGFRKVELFRARENIVLLSCLDLLFLHTNINNSWTLSWGSNFSIILVKMSHRQRFRHAFLHECSGKRAKKYLSFIFPPNNYLPTLSLSLSYP